MRWVFAVVCLLGACDYVFTIKTQPDGAAGGIGDSDTRPSVCPAIGTVPKFVTTPVQIVAARCKYSESAAAGLAIVDCVSGTGILEGPPGGPFSAPIQIDTPVGTALTDVRIAPEGDQVLGLASTATGSGDSVLNVYARSGDGWQSPAPLPIGSLVAQDTIGTATVKSGRRMIISHQDFNPGGFDEWRDLGDGSWDMPHAYTPGSFGLDSIGHPSLTPDGKRLVFTGESATVLSVYYSDRASVDDPFTSAQRIPIVEKFPFYPFLAPDCSRLYFAGVTSVSFVAP